MSNKSIGKLHSEITANASQFVNEFNRADNAQRRATANIRASVGKTMAQVTRAFSLPNLAKSLLSGLGIGGGVQLMGMAMDKVAEMFQAGAKHAADMSEHIEKMREDLRSMHDDRFATFLEGAKPGAKAGIVDREIERQKQALARAEATKLAAEKDMQLAREGLVAGRQFNLFTGMQTPDPFGGRFPQGMSSNAIFEAAQEQQGKSLREIENLQKKIGELSNKSAKVTEDATQAIEKALDEFFKPLDQLGEQEFKKLDDRAKQLVEKSRSPMEKFLDAFREVDELRQRGYIGDDFTRDSIIRDAYNQYQKDTDPFDSKGYKAWEKAAGGLKVDDYMRRGLGTGADYKSIFGETNNILKEILQAVRATKALGYQPTYDN